MALSRSRPLRLAALVVGCVTLAAAVVVFVGFRLLSGTKARPAVIMPKGIDMALGSIDHTATENGEKRWQLKAQAGQLQRASSLLLLKQVKLVIFMKNEQQMTVNADEGALDTASNDIEVSGNVVVISQGNTLSTAKLNYAHQRQVITTDLPLQLTNGQSWLWADAMTYDLKGSRVEFTGRIRALLGQGAPFLTDDTAKPAG